MAKGYDVKWRGKEFFVKATKANVRAMDAAAKLLERDIKLSFGKGASRADVKFRRTKSGKYHRPSAPGFPPNIDLSALKNSIQSSISTKLGMITGKVGSDTAIIAAEASAGTDVNYGLYLELGAPSIKLAARPYLRPMLKKDEAKINEFFVKANRKL